MIQSLGFIDFRDKKKNNSILLDGISFLLGFVFEPYYGLWFILISGMF